MKILAFRAVPRPVTNLLPARSQNDLELLVIRPASTPAGFDNSQPFNPSTVLIIVHKDCYAALTLIDRAALTERKRYYWHPLSRDDHRLAKTDKKVEPELPKISMLSGEFSLLPLGFLILAILWQRNSIAALVISRRISCARRSRGTEEQVSGQIRQQNSSAHPLLADILRGSRQVSKGAISGSRVYMPWIAN
ncbi:hypothetical protein ABIB94_004170 [Bradyrhizobium sp. JR7.2]|uniref:hypothetical protein n=1 Tax=unclassified Bradyrhizobium TaxID=2631580 RepID=UPI003397FD5D